MPSFLSESLKGQAICFEWSLLFLFFPCRLFSFLLQERWTDLKGFHDLDCECEKEIPSNEWGKSRWCTGLTRKIKRRGITRLLWRRKRNCLLDWDQWNGKDWQEKKKSCYISIRTKPTVNTRNPMILFKGRSKRCCQEEKLSDINRTRKILQGFSVMFTWLICSLQSILTDN